MLSDKSDQNDNVKQTYFSMTFSHYYDDIYYFRNKLGDLIRR